MNDRGAGDGDAAAPDGPGDNGPRDNGPAGEILVTREGAVTVVRIDREHRRNALTPAHVALIAQALTDASLDDEVRVVRLEGSGADFCTGADLRAANRTQQRPRVGALQNRTGLQAHRLIELISTVQVPVVCVVRGWAAGLGCQIALAADFTIAAEDAVFWEPFLERGFTPDSGATWLLARTVGLARARRMLLLGEKISAGRAVQWGLIHDAVPETDLGPAADDLVERLATAPTVAVGLTKACLASSMELSLSEAMAKEALALEVSVRSEDFKEGLAAFRDNREPNYRGR